MRHCNPVPRGRNQTTTSKSPCSRRADGSQYRASAVCIGAGRAQKLTSAHPSALVTTTRIHFQGRGLLSEQIESQKVIWFRRIKLIARVVILALVTWGIWRTVQQGTRRVCRTRLFSFKSSTLVVGCCGCFLCDRFGPVLGVLASHVASVGPATDVARVAACVLDRSFGQVRARQGSGRCVARASCEVSESTRRLQRRASSWRR